MGYGGLGCWCAQAGPWGPFEAIDGANALGAVATITLSDTQSASDWADLVEYCYGDTNTTWGAVRSLNDSHPNVYRVTHFELGNEQENPNFVAQVRSSCCLWIRVWCLWWPVVRGI